MDGLGLVGVGLKRCGVVQGGYLIRYLFLGEVAVHDGLFRHGGGGDRVVGNPDHSAHSGFGHGLHPACEDLQGVAGKRALPSISGSFADQDRGVAPKTGARHMGGVGQVTKGYFDSLVLKPRSRVRVRDKCPYLSVGTDHLSNDLLPDSRIGSNDYYRHIGIPRQGVRWRFDPVSGFSK